MQLDHVCKECEKHENGKWLEHVEKELQERQLCSNCNFWFDIFLKVETPESVVVDGKAYTIGKENISKHAFRGHSGCLFFIRFTGGRKVISSNLWHRGTVPDIWKDRIPDNAEFVYPEADNAGDSSAMEF